MRTKLISIVDLVIIHSQMPIFFQKVCELRWAPGFGSFGSSYIDWRWFWLISQRDKVAQRGRLAMNTLLHAQLCTTFPQLPYGLHRIYPSYWFWWVGCEDNIVERPPLSTNPLFTHRSPAGQPGHPGRSKWSFRKIDNRLMPFDSA